MRGSMKKAASVVATPSVPEPKKQARIIRAVAAATSSGPISVLVETSLSPDELVKAMFVGEVEFRL